MKLLRFGNFGQEKPGVFLDNGKQIDVSKYIEDYNEKFFENNGLQYLKYVIDNFSQECPLIPKEARIGAPIARPSKNLFII